MPAAPLHRCSACGELVRLLPDLQGLKEVPGNCTCGAETTFLKVGFHLPVWVIYDHPRDFPGAFVARLFIVDKATAKTLKAPTLEGLRALLPAGLTRLERNPQDDPVIVETWL
jgi:hypothetical protein